MLYRFFRNATFNIIADFSNRLSNAVIVILISKFLTVTNFGSYNLATTYLTFGMLISFWGYGNLLTREVSKDTQKFEKYFLNFGVMRIFFSTISLLLILIVITFMNYSAETNKVIIIISLGILAESFKNLSYSAFNAFEETHYVSLVFFLSSLLKLIISYFLLINHFGIIELAWINTIINFAGAISLIILVFRFLPPINWKFDWKFSFDQTRLAIPLFLIGVFSIAENRLDIIILSGYFTENIVGIYTAAAVLQSGLLIFPDGIRNAIFPVLSKNSMEDPVKATRVFMALFKYLTLISFAIATGSIILAPKLILTIYDKDFANAINIFRILMFSYPFYSIVILNIRFLNAYNKDAIIVKFYALDVLITIVLSIIIMPIYGGIGAAYLKVFTTGLLYFLFFPQIKFLLPKVRISGIIIKGLISSVIMGGLLFITEDFNIFINVIIGFIIYIVCLILLKAFGKDEIQLLLSLFNQRKIKNNQKN